MPNFKKNIKLNNKVTTSPIAKDEKCPIPTICVNVNELNNNTIPTSKQSILKCLPEIFTDIELNSHKSKNNNNLKDSYIKGDLYKPYIFGKFCLFSLFFVSAKHDLLITFKAPNEKKKMKSKMPVNLIS